MKNDNNFTIQPNVKILYFALALVTLFSLVFFSSAIENGDHLMFVFLIPFFGLFYVVLFSMIKHNKKSFMNLSNEEIVIRNGKDTEYNIKLSDLEKFEVEVVVHFQKDSDGNTKESKTITLLIKLSNGKLFREDISQYQESQINLMVMKLLGKGINAEITRPQEDRINEVTGTLVGVFKNKSRKK